MQPEKDLNDAMKLRNLFVIYFLVFGQVLVLSVAHEDLCPDKKDGSLSYIGKTLANLFNSENGHRTVFLMGNNNSNFTFKCDSEGEVSDVTLRAGQMRNADRGSNTIPVHVNCSVCNVSIIVVKKINEVLNLTRTALIITKPGDNIARSSFTPTVPYSPFEKSIDYFVLDPQKNPPEWKICNETKEGGIQINFGSSREKHTLHVVCPIDVHIGPSRPVLIKILEYHKKEKCIATPVLCNETDKSPSLESFITYNIDVDSVTYEETEFDTPILLMIVIPTTVLFLTLVGLFVLWLYQKRKRARIGKPEFYVETPTPYNHDNFSVRTETTIGTGGTQNYMMSVISDSDHFTYDHLKFNDSSEEAIARRKQILSRQLSGDPTKINPDLALNQQARILPYNEKYEIDRSNFEVGQLLGSGNFGSVYEGTAIGLFNPGSKTKVAIKTVNNALDPAQIQVLLCEMKVLTNLELHLNLVNLLGSCKSELVKTGELWLLLEFSPHGDMKNFLIRHREEIMSSVSNKIPVNGLNDRLFIKWAHSIAKGMEYLSSKRIMHGDLAARNILVGGLDGGPQNYVAKVSDFGLSKSFYDDIRYKKQQREYVPWKWMALEYLKDGCFTMKSDVWSFGVVLWEILSLGQEPYVGQDMHNAINEIKEGKRLPCPDDLLEIEWIEEFYTKATEGCWKPDPGERQSFSELVKIFESYLTKAELEEHKTLNEQYVTMRKLISDDTTRSKRLSAFPPSVNSNASYHKLHTLNSDEAVPSEPPLPVKPEVQQNGYLKYEEAKNDSNLNTTPKVTSVTSVTPITGENSYITISQAMS